MDIRFSFIFILYVLNILNSILSLKSYLNFSPPNSMVNSIDGVATNTAKIQNIDCGGACASRCKLSSRPNLCKRACGTCCARCSCVPPGTSGGYDACPCYASMTTHGGRRKCP
ncbi:gibberellin-regulated protein 11-like isoform X2 [Benincasa hispida]|uniref:gibberellin-regulated protein 11-like isoform X2 n=1 Tax=Benincasa hispida TaxID=102211 RepID=UPI0019029A09|nr:gibberellin-regulated protein 11-like isoform X2 [Benincasa hispida]